MHTNQRKPNALLWALFALGLFACTGGQWLKSEPHGWWSERGPVVPHATFPANCDLCHVGDDWTDVKDDFEYDHEAETGYALVGAHEGAQCLRCHNDRGPVETFAARGCAGCHEDVHEGLRGESCSTCHDESSWRVTGAIADHERTRFPLVGAHATTSCRRCHEGIEAGVMAPLDIECLSCHQSDLARATSPDHLANGWTDACERCHVPTAWSGAAFNHSTYPLTGAHRAATCDARHMGGVFGGTPRDCIDCHVTEYLGTTDPDHVASGFSQDCAQCHNTSSWDGATFDHTFVITFGDHASLGCADCHTTPGDLQTASCTHCHEHRQSEADDEHEDVTGYSYSSPACIQCHPTGFED